MPNYNFTFPIQRANNTGYAKLTTSKLEGVANNIFMFFGTRPSERVDSGSVTQVGTYLFDMATTKSTDAITRTVRQELERFFPQVNILELTVTTIDTNKDVLDNQCLITMKVALYNDPTGKTAELKVVI